VFSPEALDFAAKVLSGEVGGQRKGRERKFRASGMGTCLRRRMFAVMGVPESRKNDTTLQNIFNNGNFAHLRWQMAGLTAGWLKACEVPADTPELGTTLDGICDDDSIFEFKSINSRGFRQVTEYGADYKHVMQTHAMFIASGKDKASIVYEDKDRQEWLEVRIVRTDEVEDDVRRELDALVQGRESESLPPMKPYCTTKEGAEWRNCPFRDVCPLLTTWKRMLREVPSESG
jgi:hypothetical protein